ASAQGAGDRGRLDGQHPRDRRAAQGHRAPARRHGGAARPRQGIGRDELGRSRSRASAIRDETAARAHRRDAREWDGAKMRARELLLRETLRPAPTTDAWRALAEQGGGEISEGLNGLALVHAADPAEEAAVIALALREALETKDKTAALVTPDRALARRVAAELERWQIAIDDSAGRPLAHTPPGTFLCLLAEAADSKFAPAQLLALLKHPLATMGGDAAAFRAKARELDIALRGP